MSSEKVSFNMSVVDLAKIHMLVEKGVYTNRSDFITKAIINELNRNDDIINQAKRESDFAIGIFKYSKKDLLKIKASNKKLDIITLGMLIFDGDVDLALAKSTINSVKLYGKFLGNSEIKTYFNI